MDREELLKKVEFLEYQAKKHWHFIERQQKMLDELVAILEIHSRTDIKSIEIMSDGHGRGIIISNKDEKEKIYFGDCRTIGDLVDFQKASTAHFCNKYPNDREKFRLSIASKHRNVPIEKLPSIKYENLYANKCLILIKL